MISFSRKAPSLPNVEEYSMGEVVNTRDSDNLPKNFDHVYCLSVDGTFLVLGTICCEGWNEYSIDFLKGQAVSCCALFFESHEPFKNKANRGKSFIRYDGELIEVKIYRANKTSMV